MLKILIKKSALTEYMKKSGIVRKERVGKGADDLRFEQFKKKVLEHLDSLEEDDKELEKSLAAIEASVIGKAGYPVGTIREWKGKKYIKVAQGKWRPKYDGDTRGAKMAVALLKRKAAACTDSRELLQLILENRRRFSDAQGRPLPFVTELSEYVSALNDKLESEKTEGIPKKTRKKKGGSGGGDDGGEPPNGAEGENPTPVGKGDFGNIYDCFKHKAKDAIKFLLKNKEGEAIGALSHQEVGDIDLVYGEAGTSHSDGYGLAKLAKYHPEVLDDLQGIIDDMEVVQKTKNRAQLESKSHKASVRLTWNGKLKNWLLTAYEKISGVSDSRTDIARTDGSRKNDTATPANTASSSIPQSAENVNQNSSKATIEAIREKYQSSKSIDGEDDSITLPDGTELEGKWKLVEADAPSASHDERTFKKTEGFPSNADGSTINDRDYEHDSAAKEAVIDMAGDFDSRALGIDSPVVVSEDGVVISGNNRTMSSKIAARKGTDRKYVEALAKKARKFGFSSDDVAKFKNPRVVFEMKVNGEYSTSQFAKFNESGKKAQSPVEVAVKVSKTVNAATIESVAEKINQYDTLGELYADQKSMREVFGTLIESGVIKKTDLPAYYTDEGGITNNGKEFLETILIGSVINESNIRSLSAPGGKEIRQKLVRAIVPLVENKGMKGYSIANELNDAVNIALDIKKNKKFKDAENYSRQGVLIGENPDPIAIEFAKKLEGTQKDFAEFMRGLNVGLKPAADGEADIFAGGIESRDDILSRYISIKKSIRELLDSF